VAGTPAFAIKDVAGTTVVTAGRRLARVLRARYAAEARAQGWSVWQTPDVLPWPAWIETLWDAALYAGIPLPTRLGEHQECRLWRRILEQSPEGRQLLDLPAAAEAAQRAWELLHAWRLNLHLIEQQAGEDTRAFLGWARRFEQLSELEGWIEPVRRPDHLIPVLDRIPLPRTILLAGFDELTPQQECFVQACERAGITVQLGPAAGEQPGTAVRAAFADRARELEAAARWARALLERGEARTIAVVVPDLQGPRAEVERIFTRVLEPERMLPGTSGRPVSFNISAAPALGSHPVVHAALLALELECEGNPIGRVSAFLRSSFFAGAETERFARARLDRELRDRGLALVPVSRLRQLCRQLGPECRHLRRALWRWSLAEAALPERQRPSLWSRSFSLLLERLGWPGERPLSSEEYQAVAAFRDLLGTLARLDIVAGELTRAEALAELKDLARRTPHQAESEAAPVQILGVLETVGLRFDALWIAGLHDESWPRPCRPDPFLPLELQRRQRLPHSSAERELEFARSQTARLLTCAPRVVVSWPEREGDRELAPSPLIRDLPLAREPELKLSSCPDFIHLVCEAGRLSSFEDSCGPPLPEGSWSRGGARVFQYQALCPFRAFAELRLAAEPLRSPQPGLSPVERGSAVHAALEFFCGRVRTQARLCELSEEESAALLEEAAARALAGIELRRGALPPHFAALERTRLQRLLRQWLELEKQRLPFEVSELETVREVELAGVRADVKIDRIDRLEDGRTLILDYKTGRCKPADWEGERPADPQLPLYAVTVPEALGGLAFARITTGDPCFRGVAAPPLPAPGLRAVDLEARVAAWRTTLEELARRFLAGRAEVDPKNAGRVCHICALDPLCRVRTMDLVEPGDEDEEEDS